MEKSTAKTFLYDETFKSVKKELDVNFLSPETMLAVSEKAIATIGYWERRASKGTKEQRQMYEVEIAKLEALMQRMTDMSLDVYAVNASAYLDTRGFIEDTSVKEVLVDIAEKADVKPIEPEKEVPVVSLYEGEKELKTPKLADLATAIKSLLKKGRFDSANLLAAKYLTTGDYIPKKEKQQPVKWSEEKIASWIRDINDALMSEKSNVTKETQPEPVKETKEEIKEEPTTLKNGLTTTEVENLRLLESIIPECLPGHQDHESRRAKLQGYLNTGKDLNSEDEMLWAFAKRIREANSDAKLPQADLARLYVNIDKFSKIFFAHRPYTEDSVKAWREAAKKETGISNFKYLRVKADVDPLKLKKSGINMEAITKRVEEECLAGKTVQEVLKGLEEGILYKVIEGKSDKKTTSIYTKLHAKDLIERIYSVYATKPKAEGKSKVKVDVPTKTINADKSKVDIAEIKLLLSTIAENGGIFDDVKLHPEILNLINREIQVDPKTPALKFGKDSTLFAFIEPHFNDIKSKLPVVEITDTIEPVRDEASKEETEPESKTADLNNMITLCDFAARNDVSQEDFIKEHQALVMTKDGKFKSLMSPTTQGGSRTISIANAEDFATWVSSVYKEVSEKKTVTEDPDLVKSMKELQVKGKEILEKGTTYEVFIEWLKKNLLNRKLLEQKPDKQFKSLDAIMSFAKNTWGKKLPKPVEVAKASAEPIITAKEKTTESKEVGEPSVDKKPLSMEEVNAQIAAMSMEEDMTLYKLIQKLRDLYVANDIKVNGEMCTLKIANPLVEAIVKESNPQMYIDRQQRKAEILLSKETQSKLPFKEDTKQEATPVETESKDVTNDTETVDAEHEVFEKVDVSVKHPNVWKLIEKFNSLEEVYNQAVEFNEAGDFKSALSMCLDILPKIEASKEWTPEYITDWFNKMILKKNIESTEENVVDETSVETEPVVELGEEFNELKEAKNPKSFKRCIADILKSKEDNKELRNQIIAAINTGKGSHTRQVAKMPDSEKHKQINNIKEKVVKHESVEQN